MACGCPIVSVDVGDVKERVQDVGGCYIARTHEPQELASLLKNALTFNKRTLGRERIISHGLTNEQIAKKLIEIYQDVAHLDS